MESLYNEIGISRQAVWQQKVRDCKKVLDEEEIISLVQKWREKHPKMGSRPLYHTILNSGFDLKIGVNKFENIIKNHNLQIGTIKSRKPKTSDGKGKDGYPNLVNKLIINDINQLVVADITYYMVDGKWHYLFILKDVYSQMVVGLVACENMEASNAVECLNQYIKLRGKTLLLNCIHHSDNGSQYNAKLYLSALNNLGMKISRAQYCEQNGSAEHINHVVKNMYLDGWAIATFKELKQAVKEFKYINNNERAIEQLGYISPIKFEQSIRNIPKEQRFQKILHDFETQI
jgi:transposase InsO family protein